MSLLAALDAVRTASRIVEALPLADGLAFAARSEGGRRAARLLAEAVEQEDDVVALAALHALGQVPDPAADAAVLEVLGTARPFLREHAAWVLGSRLPSAAAVPDLVRLVAMGGFGGMLAQRTLEGWCAALPAPVAVALETAALGERDPAARARLVETLGLVPGDLPLRPLLRVTADEGEAEPVRIAAAAALGDRRGAPGVPALLDRLARRDDPLGDVAGLALADLTRVPPDARFGGPTIAQLFLHADLEPGLDTAGRGDTGGIATLLARLGDALVRQAPARRVLTLSRGSVVDARASLMAVSEGGPGHVYGRVPLLADPVAAAAAWPLRVAARRGLRRLLRSAGRVDALHLRMADVGSLAAAEVARELDIPVVFTLAPDPHAVIDALERAGALDRANFGAADLREHYWFRARLVQRLQADAAHVVLLPRPELARDLRELVGVDLDPRRATVVPEGIDLGAVDRAVEEVSGALASGTALPALADLRALLTGLPAERRHLPLLVSVGRLHRVKGMDRIVEAWAGHGLRDRANLVIVGGALDRPSDDEREQLARIAAVVPGGADAGLLLAGSRPNDVVLRWLAAARFGVPGLAPPNGAYVCGSVKEEFGIAILEAMAAGLRVVAPDGGGPATYVGPGTGCLVDTGRPAALAAAMAAVLDAGIDGADPSAVAHERFSIETMAAALGDVYAGAGAERTAPAVEGEDR